MLLQDVFYQSRRDPCVVKIDTPEALAQILFGIKIQKDLQTDEVKIYDTSSDIYKEIKPSQYAHFQNGWREGVYKTKIEGYKKRLSYLEKQIVNELNNRNNEKQISLYKENKVRIMNKYFNITQKLNGNKISI